VKTVDPDPTLGATSTNVLVGREQVAAILGVSRQRVQAMEADQLPPPLDVVGNRPIWHRTKIIDWKRKRDEARAAA
jgi:hypothetical protein